MGKIICSRVSLARYTVVKLLEKWGAQMLCSLQGLLTEDRPSISVMVVAGHAHIGALNALYEKNRRVPDDC